MSLLALILGIGIGWLLVPKWPVADRLREMLWKRWGWL